MNTQKYNEMEDTCLFDVYWIRVNPYNNPYLELLWIMKRGAMTELLFICPYYYCRVFRPLGVDKNIAFSRSCGLARLSFWSLVAQRPAVAKMVFGGGLAGAWWLIPLSKWVITPVISGLTLLIPFYNWGYNPLTSRGAPCATEKPATEKHGHGGSKD